MLTLEDLRVYFAGSVGVPIDEVDTYRHINPQSGEPTDTVTVQVHSDRLRLPGSLWHQLTVTPVAREQVPHE